MSYKHSMTTKMDYLSQQVRKLLSAIFCVLCFTTCYVGIPEAIIARTDGLNAVKELQEFLNATENMYAHLGGDDPERQLRALQATLDATDSNGYAVMIPGSQIVLLTDAPSHDEELIENVITQAKKQNVCINFFLSYSNWTGYWTIAIKTGGAVVYSEDPTSVDTFNYTHSASQCADYYKLQYDRQPRSAPSPDNTAEKCKYFSTSLFTSKVSATVNTTADLMRVTKPDGDEMLVSNAQEEKTFHDSTPQSGIYRVCVDNGTLTITVEKTENMSAIVKYLTTENSTVVFLRHTPPPACKF